MENQEEQPYKTSVLEIKYEEEYLKQQALYDIFKYIIEFSFIIGCLYGLIMLLVEF
ncbi:hypothetical protein Amet_2807 [Alkaliphilus metalliredigens QYMF]|uniref:Uncharacterized protein n=1 Tax=Alkaliphilus metalliredigens (strain QYMF) TaxID=293826 RepID=A6TRY9_ALKMQ|nr:hypothetical protein [Alkaliphilus metalliredigens]ABR48957.1 hypothetical protein Amet_2807 [Alkaliphilus metalliredigens QYMF]